jgi:hypothetical protein
MKDRPKCPQCGRHLSPKATRVYVPADSTWNDVLRVGAERGLSVLTRRANVERDLALAQENNAAQRVPVSFWDGSTYEGYGDFDRLRCAAAFGRAAYRLLARGQLVRRGL